MQTTQLRNLLLVAAVALLATTAYAKTVTVVPGDGTPLADGVAQLEDGDKLVIKKGTYGERLILDGLTDVKVIGKGRPVLDGGAAISVVSVTGCTNTTVQGLSLISTGSDGVTTSNSVSCTFKKCTADGMANGFRDTFGTGNRFMKCVASNVSNGFFPASVDGVLIDRCTAVDTVNVGVNMSGGVAINDVVIRKSKFTASVGGALVLAGVNARCERNTVVGANTGISTEVGTDMTGSVITRNKVSAPSGVGISLTARGIEVSRNKVQDVGFAGISTTPIAQPIVITRNTIRGGTIGISARVGESEITRNKVFGADTGIRVQVGVESTGGSLYDRNVVKGSTDLGIRVQTIGNTFTKNKVSGSASTDLFSQVAEDQNTFDGNKFGTTSFPIP